MERRRVRVHLIEVILMPVVMTPGLALIGMARDLENSATQARMIGGLLVAYAIMGAVLVWVNARAELLVKKLPMWSRLLDIVLASLLFSLLGTPFLFLVWAFTSDFGR